MKLFKRNVKPGPSRRKQGRLVLTASQSSQGEREEARTPYVRLTSRPAPEATPQR